MNGLGAAVRVTCKDVVFSILNLRFIIDTIPLVKIMEELA
jgi:hypothetical protein